MRTYTNLTWPGDPYRTGQQLYSRPTPRLAVFTVGRCLASVAAAIVYLPLHRTRALTVTTAMLSFGFHAASISDETRAQALAQLADLDLLQAHRHAAVLAGYQMDDDLAALRALAPDAVLRGADAVEPDWPQRSAPATGRAAFFDCASDLPAAMPLAEACAQACISLSDATAASTPAESAAGERAAARTVERALAIALTAARHLGRYQWDGILRTGEIMAAGAWDCFTQPSMGQPDTTRPVPWGTAGGRPRALAPWLR